MGRGDDCCKPGFATIISLKSLRRRVSGATLLNVYYYLSISIKYSIKRSVPEPTRISI